MLVIDKLCERKPNQQWILTYFLTTIVQRLHISFVFILVSNRYYLTYVSFNIFAAKNLFFLLAQCDVLRVVARMNGKERKRNGFVKLRVIELYIIRGRPSIT